jgi:Spy/CpxP family protein refolding chaperone
MKPMHFICSAFAMAALAASLTAGAQPAPPAPGQGPGFGEHRAPIERLLGPNGSAGRWWNNAAVVQRLTLTDDQRKSMDQILLQHRANLIDMRASLEKAELAMEPLMQADQPDENAILAQIDKVAQARADLEKANARFLLALRAKLTPEQWKGLQAWRSERRANGNAIRIWRGRGRNQGQPGPGGPEGAPAGTPPPGPGEPQSMGPQPPEPDEAQDMPPAPEPGADDLQ